MGAIALLDGDQSWSRGELQQRAGQWAAWLEGQGVAQGDVVALAVERGFERIATLLAVMQLGAVCLPLDPSYPRQRLEAMLAEAQPSCLLRSRASEVAVPQGIPATVVEEAAVSLDGLKPILDCRAQADDLAYLIYTSGSTGRPKGVAMPHRPLLALMEWQCQTSGLEEGERTLQFTPASFDVFFQEVFATLAAGGTLVLIDEDRRLDSQRLAATLAEQRIARLFLPAVALHELAQAIVADGRELPALREVITAGEQLVVTPTLRRCFSQLPAARLWNQYGPSETHVVTAECLPAAVDDWPELPSIGRALPGVELQVVDEHDQALADGEVGELLIGGVALAAGYFRNPEATAARFVALPALGPGRWYRSGDQVRRLPDGRLEFRGRADQQVKLRGYRIELGEIEAILGQGAGVAQAAAALKEGPHGPRLIAYVQFEPGESGDLRALRRRLQEQLPDYMVPAAVLTMEDWPRLPSGKLDRAALPQPDQERPLWAPPPTPPRDPAEQAAVALWCELLSLKEVGIDDSFFDFGGDSLSCVRMAHRLSQAWGEEVAVTLPFRAPTIRQLRQALQAEDRPRVSVTREAAAANDGIAIIGMHLRVPGAADPDAFWQLLQSGEDAIRHFSLEELRAAGVDEALLADPDYVRARGQIEHPTAFDAALFGISPREATLMDPQHRLFLQGCWAALESAGYAPRSVPGRVGLWGGASTGMDNSTYLLRVLHARPGALSEADRLTAMLGNQADYLCTRVSHRLDLKGPSMTVQTACSTGLVAVVEAVRALRSGACDLALAGGVSLLFPQDRGYLHQEGDIASSDGRCRPFDAAADGTLFGDGIGVVVLKPLAAAQADGDPIHAVIRGVGLNNDGGARLSYSAPNPDGQAEVLALALADAGWEASNVGMIEAHGTGTPLGDPVEVAGLRQVYAGLPAGSCALGSVKSQCGHLIAAAGVTGLIKSVLAIEKGRLVPTAHFTAPHPDLDLAHSPFFVPTAEQDWPTHDGPRRAGVSAFGLGGTNAHVLLEQAPPQAAPELPAGAQCLILSAATAEALEQQRQALADHLEKHPQLALAEVAHTLRVGRETMAHRAAVGASSLDEAIAALRSVQLPQQGQRPPAPGAAFLFPGGGAQHPAMAHGLIEAYPLLRETIEEGIAWLREHDGPDLAELWWPGQGAGEEEDPRWQLPSWQLPAIFLLEVGLARLWQAHGIEPAALIGHSMGEYAAACLAGVMSFEDALGLVALRGRLFETLARGGMLSVALPEEELRARLGNDLDLAVVNGECSCLASGTREALAELAATLEAEGIDHAMVRIEVAAHSRLVEPILEPFRRYLEGIELHAPRIPIASNLSGDWLRDDEACDPDYWVRHLRETVRFADGLSHLLAAGELQLIEVGPGRTLSSLARPMLEPHGPIVAFPSLGHADDERADEVLWQEALGRAWCAGLKPDWHAGAPPQGLRRCLLPTYPFATTEYYFHDPHAGSGEQAPAVEAVAGAPDGAGDAVEEAAAEAAAFAALPRRERIRYRLARILGQLSGHDPERMDPDQPFLEMGFDSLFLTQASLAFKRAFEVRITFRQLFNEAPDLNSLSAYIDGELDPAVEIELPMALVANAAGQGEGGAGQALVLPALHEEGAAPGDQQWRFRPFKEVARGEGGGLTAQQQAHLDALIAAVLAKTPGSKRVTAAHRQSFADPRAVGGFKTMWKEIVYPLAVDHSKGARMWDVDGNEYVDAVGGFGAILFGHAPDFLVEAVQRQAGRNLDYGPTMELAGQLTDRLCAMTGMERASFCNTGSEAVLAAMRLARTVTGRDRIATFSGDYHGLFDEVLVRAQEADGKRRNVPVAPGIPQASNSNMMVLEYGLPASLELIRAHADELAAVLVEPVQSRAPELQPHAFVKQLRELTAELGIPLIFDEIITGFRTHPRGAQAYYGIQADLAAYGKVIGGGIPIGVVAGKAEYLDAMDGGMWHYGDDSFPEAGVTYFAGTFVRHPLALAAMEVVMDRLEAGGEALQAELNDRIATFAGACNDDFEAAGLPLRMLHFASMIYPKWGGDPEFESLWFQHLRLRGLHIWEGRPGFLTTEHGQVELDFMRETFVAAAEAMIEGGFLHRETPPSGEQRIPMTGPQEELWLTTRAAPEASIALNEPCVFRLDGGLNLPILKRALRKLVARHESLRAYPLEDGTAMVVRAEAVAPELEVHDLRELDHEGQRKAAEAIYREDSRTPFDLSAPPLLRAHLIRLGDEAQELLLTVHHLIADGWSISILFHDLAQLYSRMMQGRNEDLGQAMGLAEFEAWERENRASEEHAATLAFWRERFQTLPPALELPLDHPRPRRRSYRGDRFTLTLEAELGRRLQEQAASRRSTQFSLLLAAYVAFLHRLTGQDDLVIGIPSAGQALLGANDLVAHCVHYLPFRIDLRPGETFAELAARVAAEMLAVNEHQDFTFGDLLQQEELRGLPRDPGRPTLIAVDFNVDPALDGMEWHGLESRYLSTPRDFARLELQVNLIEEDGEILVECDHALDLIESTTAHAWMEAYAELLRAVAEAPETAVDALPWPAALTPAAPAATATPTAAADFGPFRSLPQLVAEAPGPADAVALVEGGRELDRSTLLAKVHGLAQQLLADGLQAGEVIALHLGRSLELTIAQLAVWEAGGVCLMLDPTHPLERRQACLRRSQAVRLLHGAEAPPEVELADLPRTALSLAQLPSADTAPALAIDPEAPAYILFTSGSTGTPKGVVVPHRGLFNLLKSFQQRPGCARGERWLAVINPTFDMSLVEVFLPLVSGGVVCLAPGDRPVSGRELLALIRDLSIDTIQATPANWRMLLEAGLAPADQLRIISGGEALTPALAAALLPCARELWNAYGPTEITVYACLARIEAEASVIPIGYPVDHVGLHLLDEQGQPVAAGEVGELCISGPGLALAYLDMPEETAARFPTLELEGQACRVYRSGDLARRLPDGQIQCLGRNDDQIKLRGYRIECGEVEAALESLPDIAQAAVALRTDQDGEPMLVAWLRPQQGELAEVATLRRELARVLPSYMIPARFLAVEAFPLTTSAKIDRKALVLPQEAPRATTVSAEADLFTFLHQLWMDMLGVDLLDPEDDFFLLGGNSLMGQRMLMKVEHEIGLRLDLGHLLAHPNLRAFNDLVDLMRFQQQDEVDPPEGGREEVRL